MNQEKQKWRHDQHASVQFLKREFEEVVHYFQKPLISFLYYFVRDEQTALDLAQDTFLKTYSSLSLYDPQKRFSSWLFAIGANLAKDHLRRVKKHSEISEDLAIQQPLPQESKTPDHLMEKSELKELLDKSITQLPVEYKEVILLRYMNYLSIEEIAITMEVSVGTVKTRLFRGRQRLQEIIKKMEISDEL